MSPSYRRAPIVWFLVLASACATPASPTEVLDSAAAEAAGGASDIVGPIVQITNAERVNTGLPALRTSSRLMEAAQLHADRVGVPVGWVGHDRRTPPEAAGGGLATVSPIAS